MKLSEMTDEQKRIACAEAMGWKSVGKNIDDITGFPPRSVEGFEEEHVPDFLKDRDVCNELILELKPFSAEEVRYFEFLTREAGPTETHKMRVIAYANPASIVDAFLLATGRAEL